MYGVLGIIITIIGIIGNILALIVLRHPCLASGTFLYLKALAVFDTLVLICMFAFYSLPTLSDTYKDNYGYLVPYISFFIPMIVTCSIYTTVACTIDRYIAVCHPLRVSRWCTIPRVQKTLVLIIVGSCLFNIPKLFESQTIGNGEYFNFNATDFGSGLQYRYVYKIAMYVIVLKVIPFGILIVLNGLLIYRVRQSNIRYLENSIRTRRENNLTKMLIIVVMVFLICMAPAIVDNYYAVTVSKTYQSRAFYTKINCYSTLLVITNSALNFYLYCLFGNKFRRAFVAVIWDRRWNIIRMVPASRSVSVNRYRRSARTPSIRSELREMPYKRDFIKSPQVMLEPEHTHDKVSL